MKKMLIMSALSGVLFGSIDANASSTQQGLKINNSNIASVVRTMEHVLQEVVKPQDVDHQEPTNILSHELVVAYTVKFIAKQLVDLGKLKPRLALQLASAIALNQIKSWEDLQTMIAQLLEESSESGEGTWKGNNQREQVAILLPQIIRDTLAELEILKKVKEPSGLQNIKTQNLQNVIGETATAALKAHWGLLQEKENLQNEKDQLENEKTEVESESEKLAQQKETLEKLLEPFTNIVQIHGSKDWKDLDTMSKKLNGDLTIIHNALAPHEDSKENANWKLKAGDQLDLISLMLQGSYAATFALALKGGNMVCRQILQNTVGMYGADAKSGIKVLLENLFGTETGNSLGSAGSTLSSVLENFYNSEDKDAALNDADGTLSSYLAALKGEVEEGEPKQGQSKAGTYEKKLLMTLVGPSNSGVFEEGPSESEPEKAVAKPNQNEHALYAALGNNTYINAGMDGLFCTQLNPAEHKNAIREMYCTLLVAIANLAVQTRAEDESQPTGPSYQSIARELIAAMALTAYENKLSKLMIEDLTSFADTVHSDPQLDVIEEEEVPDNEKDLNEITSPEENI